MPIERTIAIVKPDGVMLGFTQVIKGMYESLGLRIVRELESTFTKEQAASFYAEHSGKNYMAGLILAMSSGPSVVLELEGEDAITRVRKLNGATDPNKADDGTIRKLFRSAGGPFNTVHGSDSTGAYERERKIAFNLPHEPKPHRRTTYLSSV